MQPAWTRGRDREAGETRMIMVVRLSRVHTVGLALVVECEF